MSYLDVINHGFRVLIHSHISQYFDSKTLREFWFLVSCQDGRVVTWGNSSCGGDSSKVKDQLIEIEECLVEPQHRRWQIMTNQAVDTCSTLFSHQLFTYVTYFTSFLDMKVATPVRSTKKHGCMAYSHVLGWGLQPPVVRLLHGSATDPSWSGAIRAMAAMGGLCSGSWVTWPPEFQGDAMRYQWLLHMLHLVSVRNMLWIYMMYWQFIVSQKRMRSALTKIHGSNSHTAAAICQVEDSSATSAPAVEPLQRSLFRATWWVGAIARSEVIANVCHGQRWRPCLEVAVGVVGAYWVCLKIGYIPNYSHLIGIMIINHWV